MSRHIGYGYIILFQTSPFFSLPLQAFSALGLLPVKSNSALSDRIPAHIMKASEWVNIPRAYLDNSSMLKSLLPLLYLSTAAFLLEIIDVGVDPDASSTAVAMSAATSVAAVQTTAPVLMSYMAGLLHTTELPALDTSLVLSIMTSFGAFLTGDLPPEVAMVIDAISVLLLIRMAKIIGTDRDCIIAEKIQTVAAEFPVS